ncbi:DHA2 family efflux MFS transporter permease subunit [Fructobacillus tropaeoli]|uniref:MFS transporter n=1 Tax=Fructobacillus tropaeoli TaxID=709323 RepID=UPI001455E3B1|nr:MFS transporter [Fructobacillus tropaeoli]NLS38074.1 DHA2 family efflux MFS transporter permease subunit [Fructobacillus tropaeoli]
MFKKYSLSFIFILGIFICMLDTTVMNVALPAISTTTNTNLNTLSWALNAYTIIFASFTIPLTRIAEIYGKKKFFFLGTLLFSIGSLISGFSFTFIILLIGRIIQSFGAAILFPLSMSMGIELIEGKTRTSTIAILGITQGLASAMGPTVGGMITQYLTWHWIFFINVPLAVIIIFLGIPTLRKTTIIQSTVQSIDFFGSLLGITMLASFTSVLIEGRQWGWTSAPTIALILVALISLIVFILVESKIQEPMISLDLFKNRNFLAAAIVIILSNLFLVAVTVLLPNYFVNIENYSTLNASYMITPITFCIFIMSPLSGFLLEKIGPRWLVLIGFLLMGIGYELYANFNALNNVAMSSISGAFVGMGYGIITGPITVIAAADFEGEQLSSSQSVASVLRQVGISMAVAIFVSGLYTNLASAQRKAINYSNQEIVSLHLPNNVIESMKKQSAESIKTKKYKSKTNESPTHIKTIDEQIDKKIDLIKKNSKKEFTSAFSNLYKSALPFMVFGTFSIFIFPRKKEKLYR